MVKIYEKLRFGGINLVGQGTSLKGACYDWECDRTCNDDLWNAFKSSKYYNDDLDFDEEVEMYNEWYDSLSGEEVFDIMRDGTYTFWINTEV